MLEDTLGACVPGHKGRGVIALSGIRLRQQLSGEYTDGTYEALYGRPCRSPLGWTEVGEGSITGPDLIRDTYEKVSLIRQRLLTAQSRQKSYADVRRRPLEFEVDDHVFLRVMPKRAVTPQNPGVR